MTYRLSRAYLPPRRFRYPYRNRRSGSTEMFVGIAVVLVLVAAKGATSVVHHPGHAPAHHATVAQDKAAAAVVAYARAQVGNVPYVWGGTTTAGFDCSGLAQAAYASAGISIQRTSQEQWASEPHVSAPAAGDLVFFAGADGTSASPGHVGIVVNPATHLMVDAYETGTFVRYDTYGLPSSAGGLSVVVGFTDPGGA